MGELRDALAGDAYGAERNNMTDAEWLAGLGAGDLVAYDWPEGIIKTHRITRITITKIIIGRNHFRRKDGTNFYSVGPRKLMRPEEPTCQE